MAEARNEMAEYLGLDYKEYVKQEEKAKMLKIYTGADVLWLGGLTAGVILLESRMLGISIMGGAMVALVTAAVKVLVSGEWRKVSDSDSIDAFQDLVKELASKEKAKSI